MFFQSVFEMPQIRSVVNKLKRFACFVLNIKYISKYPAGECLKLLFVLKTVVANKWLKGTTKHHHPKH